MAKNMLEHENESADMAHKLTLMKNQIMENDTGFGMSKRYGCVRKGLLKVPEANTITFCNEGGQYYMEIDSKKEKISINMNNIDSLKENDAGNIVLVYYMPVQ